MSVKIQISQDPHNPSQTPREETAANVSAAVSQAIRCGWTCVVSYTAKTPTDKDRAVTVEDGKVTSQETKEDLDHWTRMAVWP